MIPSPDFQLCLSVPLYFEWRDVLTREEHHLTDQSVETALAWCDYIAAHAHLQDIYFLWRHALPDANDELAFAAGARYIATHNTRHFRGSEEFGVVAMTPGHFLRHLPLP